MVHPYRNIPGFIAVRYRAEQSGAPSGDALLVAPLDELDAPVYLRLSGDASDGSDFLLLSGDGGD